MAVKDVGARIRARFKRFGLSATPAQLDQLAVYFGLLTKWNKTVNLTSLGLDPPTDEALNRLFVEPFLAARLLGGSGSAATGTLIDVGSGGGSPAIPLKIALPAVRLHMVESKARKSAFLREVIRHLGLADAEVLTNRLEELLPMPRLHEAASFLSLRAVRVDRRFWKTVSAFVRPGGAVLWFRTHVGREPDGLLLPFELEAVESLILADRSELAILRKR